MGTKSNDLSTTLAIGLLLFAVITSGALVGAERLILFISVFVLGLSLEMLISTIGKEELERAATVLKVPPALKNKKVLGVSIFCILVAGVFVIYSLAPSPLFKPENLKFVTNGHASFLLTYSVNVPVTATLYGPENEELDSVVLSPRNTWAELKIAEAPRTPTAGSYRLVVVDSGGEVIWEDSENFSSPDIGFRLLSVDEWGVDENTNLTTIKKMSVTIANKGDLPAYVLRVRAFMDGVLVGVGEVPRPYYQVGYGEVMDWILPQTSENFTLDWRESPGIVPGVHPTKFSVEGEGGELWKSPWPRNFIAVPSPEEILET
jgi:hypothetical protein